MSISDLASAARDPRLPGIEPFAGPPITIERLPQPVNLVLVRGDSFYMTIAVDDLDGQPADLTGASCRSQIRQTVESAQIAGTLDPVIAGNEITLYLLATVSAALPLASVYDVELTDAGGLVTTLITGSITLRPDVTR
jgi:hypothetical protein